MMTEPQAVITMRLQPEGRIDRRSRRWIATALVVGILALIVSGALWNRDQPEKEYERARRALQSGDRLGGLREARRLIGTPGFEGHGRLLFGLHLAQSGKPTEALSELKIAAGHEATAVEAMTAMARCFYLLGRYVDVIDSAHAALARDASALDARRWLAAAYYDLGANSDAIAELSAITNAAPEDPQPERLLGLIRKDEEQFEQAVVHYHESLRRRPEETLRSAIALELAECLVKLGRFDETLQVLADCDRSAQSLSLAAECARSLGRMEEAQDLLRDAIHRDPRSIPATLQLGSLLLEQGRIDEAAALFEIAVRQSPNHGLAHYRLSQAYARLGDAERSSEQLQLFQQAQQLERQFSDLHEQAAKHPEDAGVRYRLGVLARQLHKPDLARMWFRATLALAPNHASARASLITLDEPAEAH